MTSGGGIYHLPIWRGPFVENGAHSFAIEPQTESILRCKLRYLCLPIFLIQWPNAFQVLLVNRAVLPLAMHPVFDLFRQRFHCCVGSPRLRVRKGRIT
jgi:hypothetical protein